MSAELRSDFELEIAHVLFMDVVGYSKLLVDEQRELLNELNQIVRGTEQFRNAEAAGKLIRLPTGDGMALAFFTNPESPVKCALEICAALKNHQRMQLRIGIHSGPVSAVTDVNERSNVAGAGINIAQRVMDCGDAGHILLSKRIAEDLAQYSQWRPMLHDLGECEVKHGVRLHVVNLHADGIGNAQLSDKIKKTREEEAAKRPPPTVRRVYALIGAAVLLTITLGLLFYGRRHVSSSDAEIPQKSIAVLPFENLSAEKDDAFFADGIQDDVLTSLGKIKNLTVIARASVMAYRGAAIAGKLRKIGQTLRVSHVLEGSVRRSGNHAVINVQLIDTRNDKQVWSQRYERNLSDVLSLQGEVAVEIARELQATLTPSEKSLVSTKPTENAEAYVLYLRARELELRYRFFNPDYATAAKLYQQAIDLDPSFALARARLSIRLSTAAEEGDATTMAKRQAKGLAEAEEALRLRPEMGEGRLALGVYYWQTNNPDRALVELAQAEKLLPNSAEVWQIRASIYRLQNKIRERIIALQRGETLDPRDSNGLLTLAITFRTVRDWPEAIEARKRLLATLPTPVRGAKYANALDEFRMTGKVDSLRKVAAEPPTGREGETAEDCAQFQYHFAMLTRDFATAGQLVRELPAEDFTGPKAMQEALLAMARGGDHASVERTLISARQEIEKRITASPNDFNSYINLGLIDAFLGRKNEAIREAQRAIEVAIDPLQKNDASAALALIHARIGESDQAIDLIEHLITVPANLFVITNYDITLAELKWRWEWDPLRNNPRFQKILAGPEPKTVY
jgi:TolB-like protein/class 3 adenylate cyclase